MTDQIQHRWFKNTDEIVSDDLQFKSRLGIDNNQYPSNITKELLQGVWDIAGVAASATSVAKSPVVANLFTKTAGILSVFGVGKAVTPIGWVIAAAVISGGAWPGITRHLKKGGENISGVIPGFINTPFDVLALGFFDLLAPLSIKVALADGSIQEDEREYIQNHFVKEWGFNKNFVNEGLKYVESNISDFSVEDLAETLAEFQKKSPDSDYEEMSRSLFDYLIGIAVADSRVQGNEAQMLERIKSVFDKTYELKVLKFLKDK